MIIERYIGKKFLTTFISVTLILLILGITGEIILGLDKILSAISRDEALSIATYLMYKAIFMLYFLVPTSFSLAAALCFCSLWKSNELIPVLAAGMSRLKLFRGVIVLGLLFGLMTFAIEELYFPKLIPELINLENSIKAKEVRFKVTSVDRSGSRLDAIKYDRINGILEGEVVAIILDDNFDRSEYISANRAVWDSNEGSWVFYEGYREQYVNGMSSIIDIGGAKVVSAGQKLPEQGYKLERKLFAPSTFHKSGLISLLSLNIKQTRKMIRVHSDMHLYKIRLALKFANIFVPLCLALACAGLIMKRQVKWYAMAISIALIFNLLFYISHFTFIKLGILGSVDPYISAFISSAVFLVYFVLV